MTRVAGTPETCAAKCAAAQVSEYRDPGHPILRHCMTFSALFLFQCLDFKTLADAFNGTCSHVTRSQMPHIVRPLCPRSAIGVITRRLIALIISAILTETVNDRIETGWDEA